MRSVIKISALGLCLTLTLTACGQMKQVSEKAGARVSFKKVDKKDKGTSLASDKNEQEKKLCDLLGRLEQVEKVNVLISTDIAIVGATLRKDLKEADILRLKKKIEELILREEPEIKRVAVTTSEEMFKRIEKISKPEEKGEEEIIGELTPIL